MTAADIKGKFLMPKVGHIVLILILIATCNDTRLRKEHTESHKRRTSQAGGNLIHGLCR